MRSSDGVVSLTPRSAELYLSAVDSEIAEEDLKSVILEGCLVCFINVAYWGVGRVIGIL
jgi:hypothetical protein